MNTLLKVERKIRKVVFKSLWKVLDVKDLTDVAMLGLFVAGFIFTAYKIINAL